MERRKEDQSKKMAASRPPFNLQWGDGRQQPPFKQVRAREGRRVSNKRVSEERSAAEGESVTQQDESERGRDSEGEREGE